MKVEINTLYWDNGAPLIDSHKKVTQHFGLPVTYFNLNGFPHGLWMNELLNNTKNDVIGFFDSDCVPTNIGIVSEAVDYVISTDSFIGIAQASNHIKPASHIFAAPAFFFITKSCYERMKRPPFSENARSDVAEEVSYRAEDMGIHYRALYPTHYERPSTDGIWKLGNYGNFGIGTHFTGGIYHLYQGRYQKNIDLFATRCNEIITGSFSTDNMISTFEY